ncbi:hypothetical protein M9Y10_021213 [Tritrichomonas musculus]|uniref:Uncharacterized protein n=1 Tax=Tritrichomonas musculus TaxID=1915356 RepID=A0ABR2HEG4_9EUKA
MELFQLNSSHFNQQVMVKAKIIRVTQSNENMLISMQSLKKKRNLPSFLGGIMLYELDNDDLMQGIKFISGKYIFKKKSKNRVFLPYMEIEKIMPFYNNDDNSDDDDGEEEEEEDGDQVHHNFFTEENLCSFKFPTGDEFFTFLQRLLQKKHFH